MADAGASVANGSLPTAPPILSLTTTDVEEALAPVQAIVAADGGDLVVTGIDTTTALLRLVLDTAECRECVMPRAYLEQIALDMMQPSLPTLTAVRIDDPRELSL